MKSSLLSWRIKKLIWRNARQAEQHFKLQCCNLIEPNKAHSRIAVRLDPPDSSENISLPNYL